MPIQITHPLDLDAHEREIEVVADPKDPAAGTARFALRELPHGKAKALLARRLSAVAAHADKQEATAPLRQKLIEGQPLTVEEAEQFGAATGVIEPAIHAELLEFVRWGVAGHRAEDFIHRGESVPFVGEDASFLGQPYRVASAEDLARYASIGRKGGHLAGPLFAALLRAIELYQEGKIETSAEVWERGE